jgi:hypothetical protein
MSVIQAQAIVYWNVAVSASSKYTSINLQSN